jgi:ABC-2 type transport system permease protein
MKLKNINTIFRKEFNSYFNTLIGYIFLSLFLLLISFLFFYGLGGNSFWDLKISSMEHYFSWVPILFIFFIPAITMRLWSEEEKSGTMEILMTLPVSDVEVVLGKFFSAWSFLLLGLSGTILVPITIWILGDLDFGLVISGYIGTLLLGGAYISLGLLISSLTREQIVAFLVTLFSSLFFFLMGHQTLLQFLGNSLGGFIAFFSLSQHFESFRMGVFDPRDIFFFLSFISLMLFLNVFSIRGKR